MTSHLAIGIACALLAAVLGTGWQLATRYGVTSTLGPWEIAVLRYGVPALVLLPVWIRVGLKPASMRWPHLVLLVAGGGLPFGLLVVSGAQFAPAAHLGVFMAGTMPLFTALLAWAVERDRVSPLRLLGFVVILAGVALAGFSGTAPAGSWRGDLLFLAAAAAWAVHTVAFRRSGLGPWQGAAVTNGWSAVVLLALLPFVGAPRLLTAPAGDLLLQFAWQGLLAGLMGLVAYMAAVERLGAARAALSSALVPVFTALGAALLLGEPLGAQVGVAVALVSAGVVLASGALPFGARPARSAPTSAPRTSPAETR